MKTTLRTTLVCVSLSLTTFGSAADPVTIKLPGVAEISGAAASPTPPPMAPPLSHGPGADLVISTVDDKPINISVSKLSEITVLLKNTSDHDLTLTHFSVNSPGVFVAIPPITIAPGKSKDFALTIDGKNIGLPSRTSIFFLLRDAKGETSFRSGVLPLTSKDVLVFEPRAVFWKVGDAPKPQTVHILNVPAGVKISEVKASSSNFAAKLEGENIIITPTDTAKTFHGDVVITTDAPGRGNHINIPVLVVEPPPAPSSAPIAPKL